MPGLAQRNEQHSNGSLGFWSKNSDDICYKQLQKFWSDLSPKARQKLLRIDKQTLFEQARKNMYCSRCNGLLLEGFLQIVMYGKSLQQEEIADNLPCQGSETLKNCNGSMGIMGNGCSDDMQDPSVHPWGGLTTNRDGSLTLLDCFLCSNSLKGLQNVFDSARARERERELLYPDACGGGGRGWISQGIVSYGRLHGTRETCALHTARLSCDTLVDFWSALGDETRRSLLRMKEEDFIERLMYRFDSKRFCRDCRRNVIREFKELKELKRMRKEPRCTPWFCVADTAFQYEVSLDTVQADWCQTFADAIETYHHFEWAIGTGEGKCDILDFENVGMNGNAQVNGLDLRGLNACYITLRALKMDGRSTELCVKAHALKGQQCVHCRLVVGDGFVSIKRGESIRRFFEHAEEAEEEEDEEFLDKDGNEIDGECSRPQKHAKSPELAREFLLDASTVIFKEQVEKAFREGTARQNAHSIFVCLALKLLEERVHIACKEIITLEKQTKLLEEEEKEKREEEERKERKRMKEREKKLRRKERLKGKERAKEKTYSEANDNPDGQLPNFAVEPTDAVNCKDSTNVIVQSRPSSAENLEDQSSSGRDNPEAQGHSCIYPDSEVSCLVDEKDPSMYEQSTFHNQRLKPLKDSQLEPPLKWSEKHRHSSVSSIASIVNRSNGRCHCDRLEISSRCYNGPSRKLRVNAPKTSGWNGMKGNEKFKRSFNGEGERYGFHSCSCKQGEYKAKVEGNVIIAKPNLEASPAYKSESILDVSKSPNYESRYCQTNYTREGSSVRSKTRTITVHNPAKDLNLKKVWERMERKYPQSSSDSDITSRISASKANSNEQNGCATSPDYLPPTDNDNLGDADQEITGQRLVRNFVPTEKGDSQNMIQVQSRNTYGSCGSADENGQSCLMSKSVPDSASDRVMTVISNSENSSSCLSEGDSQAAFSNNGSSETSSTSDSEDCAQQSQKSGKLERIQNGFIEHNGKWKENYQEKHVRKDLECKTMDGDMLPCAQVRTSGTPLMLPVQNLDNGVLLGNGSGHHDLFSPILNHGIQFPVFHPPYVSWPAHPATGMVTLPHPNQYLYAGPLGYSVNGKSPFCMQYNGLHHTGAPLFNVSPVSVFHPVTKANALNTEEQKQNKKPPAEMTHNSPFETKAGELGVPARACHERGGEICDDSVKSNASKETGFSLFHFGGPVALSKGCKTNPVLSKDRTSSEFSSQFLSDHMDAETAGSEKDRENGVEEYNLFAASNGLKFSFF